MSCSSMREETFVALPIEVSEVSIASRMTSAKEFIHTITFMDTLKGICYGLYFSRSHLLHSYCIVPVGIIILFVILYGLNQLLTNVLKIKFPCSVLGMLINLVLLCILNVLSNLESNETNGKTFKATISNWSKWIMNHYLSLIKPSMNFTLKWINVFFIPSFIILPLSDAISFIECLKIAGVFIVGFLILFCFDVYLILALKLVLQHFGLFERDTGTKSHPKTEKDVEETELNSNLNEKVFTTTRDDITTIDLSSFSSVKSGPFNCTMSINGGQLEPLESPIEGSSKNKIFANPTEPDPTHHKPYGPPVHTPIATSMFVSDINAASDSSSESSKTESERTLEDPFENLSDNARLITIFLTKYIDWILYLLLFIVSLPFYYISSIHTFLPYHLGLTILAYYIALLIPQKWPASKKFAHPILISTGEILLVCFIGSLIYHHGEPKGFINDLKYYKTGKSYLYLFNNETMAESGDITTTIKSDYTATPKWFGCGDVLSSLMDISIVALSLPMFSYRRDFTKNFWILTPPILISIALTFFLYPLVCYNIGIESARSIGFIGRSVTLALGTPLITALDGSISLMACCTIMSGICGVLVGDTIFKFLRISKNDYVTRGVSLGINCGAIATAHLLNIDPRAASMSSLSFSLFGTVMVIMASIGAVRELIQSWVGM